MAVAVHCRAGLGRTGTLIGCYLMHKYRIQDSKAMIAWMRLCRPGMVVGDQQQFMAQYQRRCQLSPSKTEKRTRQHSAPGFAVPFKKRIGFTQALSSSSSDSSSSKSSCQRSNSSSDAFSSPDKATKSYLKLKETPNILLTAARRKIDFYNKALEGMSDSSPEKEILRKTQLFRTPVPAKRVQSIVTTAANLKTPVKTISQGEQLLLQRYKNKSKETPKKFQQQQQDYEAQLNRKQYLNGLLSGKLFDYERR